MERRIRETIQHNDEEEGLHNLCGTSLKDSLDIVKATSSGASLEFEV